MQWTPHESIFSGCRGFVISTGATGSLCVVMKMSPQETRQLRYWSRRGAETGHMRSCFRFQRLYDFNNPQLLSLSASFPQLSEDLLFDRGLIGIHYKRDSMSLSCSGAIKISSYNFL